MFKHGSMSIGNAMYTLYEMKIKGFYRFDIMKKGGEFNVDVGSVLFSYYKRKRRKRYGDEELFRQYIDTVTALQKMQGEIITESKWDYGRFYHTIQKGEPDNRLITRTINGEWQDDIYEHDGITIFMRVYDSNFNIAVLPVNSRDYEYVVRP